MPGMVAFGRRWAIATDDFIVIGIVDSIFFLGWWCWSIIVQISFKDGQDCDCPSGYWCILLQVFFGGVCCLYLLNIILAVSFLVFSMRGTLSNPKPREFIVSLVYVKSILSLLDLIWAILGSVLLSQHFVCKYFNVELTLKIFTGCFWFMFLVRLVMIWLFYDPKGRRKSAMKKLITNEYFPQSAPEGAAKKWRHRLQAFCFWFIAPSRDKALAITTVSHLLAFLAHDQDLVASDFIAALKLYKRECFEKHKDIETALESAPSITLPDGTAVDCFPTPDFPPWMNLKLASHYFSIGMGVFGWPWTVYRNLPCGLCSLWKYIKCCFYCRKNVPKVDGDNCCGCNLAGLQVTSNCRYEDLVHVSFMNDVYEIPFFVAIDESTSSVVLTLRGSMSCADALTDVSATYSPLAEECFSNDTLCHTGMLMAARRVKDKLEHFEVLQKAFHRRVNYHLVLIGHSLGAGVASLLTLLLRKSYPNIRCFAFASPPVLNEPGLDETKDCIFTVYFGNDLVPYFNYQNIRGVILKCSELVNKCQLPKYKVLLGWFDSNENCNGSLVPAINSDNSSKFETTIPEVVQVEDVENNIENDDLQQNSASTNLNETKLLVQGRILHIKHSKFGYRFRICDPRDYQPLILGPDMIYHHFPQFMGNCLKEFSIEDTVRLKTS